MRSFFILLLAVGASFGQTAPTFRVEASQVKVDVQVTDRGRTIGDLTRDDFVLLDEGARQAITYFGRETEPVWVLLLLDVSGSTRKHVKQMGVASPEALQALNPGDHVGIMVFGRHTDMRREFSDNVDAISRAILGSVHARGLGSGTRINASVIAAADHMRETLAEKPGRRAIVILTDNTGLNYKMPNEKVIRALYDADAVLHAIAVGGAKPPEPLKPGANPDFSPPDVFLLAAETGGEVVRAKKTGAAFRGILDRIRMSYTLHYTPPAGETGRFRRIEVQLSPEARKRRPKARVRARSGYYAPGESGDPASE